MENFKTLFPSAFLSDIPKNRPGYLSIPCSDGKWLTIATEELTEREHFLLKQLNDVEQSVESTNPWYSFLVKNQGKLPTSVKLIQFLHIRVIRHPDQSDLEAEWLEIVSQLLPNLITSFKVSRDDFVFILNQELHFDMDALLTEILASVEFDFGIKMTALLGQIWPQKLADRWSQAYQLEAKLFKHNLSKVSYSQFNRFSLSLLLATSDGATAELYQLLALVIFAQDEMEETIRALWQEQAVVTKTAQRLYVHRNTLQYRLDKFQEQTGLSLKSMDDLAVCYIALIRDKA